MKSTTSTMRMAAATCVLTLAVLASAQDLCAIQCFQEVVTEHPPLTCTEENMYLCFCKGKDLQNWFGECVYSKCAAEAEASLDFGVNLCKELGVPITAPAPPATTTTSATAAPPAVSTTASTIGEPIPSPPAPSSSAAETIGEPIPPSPSSTEASDESTPTSYEEPETYPTPSEAPAESSSEVEHPSSTLVPHPQPSNGTVPHNPDPVETSGASSTAVSGLVALAGAALVAYQLI